MLIISLLVVLYSKQWKQPKYWKRKMEEYNERSDEGAVMDSQDEFDHGVCPMDSYVMGYQERIRLALPFDQGVSGMLICNTLEVLQVSGKGLYMLLR